MILACDPGLDGAFAFNDWRTGQLDVVPMPTRGEARQGFKYNKRVIDEQEVVALLAVYGAMGCKLLFLEAVGGRPGQSAPAAFWFGVGYGIVVGAAAAAGLEVQTVPPATWKSALKVPSNKQEAIARASAMLPTHKHLWPRKKDDGKAEAALLSLYGQRVVCGEFTIRKPKEKRAIEVAAESRATAAARQEDRARASRARVGGYTGEPKKRSGHARLPSLP